MERHDIFTYINKYSHGHYLHIHQVINDSIESFKILEQFCGSLYVFLSVHDRNSNTRETIEKLFIWPMSWSPNKGF